MPDGGLRRVVILTAIPVEYQAVRAHLTKLRQEMHPSGTVYERGDFITNDQSWDVLIVETGAGNTKATAETVRAIEYFKPSLVLFVGVAGGLKDVKLGDVVAATKVYGYESGKADPIFRPRPDVHSSTHRMEQRARAEAKKQDWIKRLMKSFPDPNSAPSVYVAPIASGNQIAASTDSAVLDLLRSNYGDAVAVEMEGYGFLEAIRTYPNIDALIIRGISDLIDDKFESDAKRYQEVAAGHASAFAFEILAKLDSADERRLPASPAVISGFTSDDPSDQEKLDSADERRLPASSAVISGFTSDDPSGQDLLGIKKEVEALCSILAAKDVEPPLSLGLFGDWGSGKSFFMRMMQERIEKLKEAAQRAEGETAYCKDIVQLKFNAWHYIDTDLWASLTSEIFEGLARALVKKDDADSEYMRARLLANTIRSKDELAKAEREKSKADAKLQESQQRLKQLERYEATVEANLTPQAIIQGAWHIAIRQPEALEETKKELSDKMEQAAKELNYPTTDAMKAELKTQLLELRGIWGTVQALAIAIRNVENRRAWLSLILGVVLIILSLIFILVLLFVYRVYLIGTLGSIFGLLLGIIVSLKPFMPGVQRALSLIKQAQEEGAKLVEKERQRKQKELQPKHEALQREVADAQQHLEKAQQRLEKASSEVRDNEQEMEAMRADRQMSDFIKQRQASTIYTKHLGVIAQAREDFEKLSILLAKEKEDAEKGTAADQEGQLLPRIDRIILYIDDLDRCPENQVVDVLQAVHLLLAFPLFIVVVGVDSRWLLHSLKQHSKAFQSEAREGNGMPGEEHAHWQSTPLDYLEKIFQIPYTLRSMQVAGFERLVDVLTSRQKSTSPAGIKSEQDITGEEKAALGEDMAHYDDMPTARVDMPEPNEQHLTPSPSPQGLTPAVNALSQENIDLNPRYLQIEDWERTVMKKLYRFIPSPRAAKRFANVYRLLRALIDNQKLPAFIGGENGGQHRCVLLLLAMLIGYPAETIEIFRVLSERKQTETWWNFIDSFKSRARPSVVPINSATPNNVIDAETERWGQLLEKLTEVRSLIREDQSCADFEEYALQVARYSYQSRPVLFAQ